MEDLNQHFEQLRRLLVKLNYPHPIDRERICLGVTTELLPLLHFGLLSHSKVLAAFVLDAGYDLYKQNDLRFTEGIFKLVRNEFAYHPVLQCAQFLTDKGFAKRKIQFVVKCLKLGIAKHNELIKKRRQRKQAKVSWEQTELAKKTEREHKSQQAQLAAASASANEHSKARKPKKPRKTHKAQSQPMSQPDPVPVSAMMAEETQNLDDSLSADQIRCHLPRPITFEPAQSQPQPQTEQEQQHEEDIHAEQAQEESKVMTPSEQQNASQIRSDEANQSIQIPQSTYDMNLIPEYDPAMYAATTQSQDAKQVMASREHYSSAYLDTYSTLMMDDEEEEDDEDDDQNQDDDDREEHKAHGQSQPQSAASQNTMQIVRAKDNDENEDDENDGNERGDDEEDNEDEPYQQASVTTMIIERLDRMESRMDEQFQAITARLTVLESKMKMVEASQSTLSSRADHAPMEKKAKSKDSQSEAKMEAKEEEAPQPPSTSKGSDDNTFAESTVGSSSLPVSLTPITSAAARHRHPSAHIQSLAQQSQQLSNFQTSVLQPMHAATARSPFLGTAIGGGAVSGGLSRHSYGAYSTSSVGASVGGQSMYGGNPHVDMMRYPVSSSSGNGHGFVPRIQRMELSSGNTTSSGNVPSSGVSGGSEADDPDNTLNFINELKEMLKSTDQLLKAKPASLYDNM